MECFEKQKWIEYSKAELDAIYLREPDPESYMKVLSNWDMIAKPLDGLGRFEKLIAKIGAIQRTDEIVLDKRAVFIFCSDNGVVAEGISQSGQDITKKVAVNMAKKITSVGRMASRVNVETIPIDIGIASEVSNCGILNRKVRMGTRNFSIEPAMTEEETIKAIATGVDLVADYKKRGYQLLGLGEMGIGNTTTSSAVAAALLHCPIEEVTGRGAGLSDRGLQRKKEVIQSAITKYNLIEKEPFEILCTVGGLDIAGLVGTCIGGAIYGIPIVLDGVISMVAALLAERMKPGVKKYLIPSHKGKEPAIQKLAEELQIEPVIDGQMALGEGTGAVMMIGLLDLALEVYSSRITFQKANIEQYKRFES